MPVDALHWKVSYTEEPDLAVRRRAYAIAKEIAANRDGGYGPPLEKAAEAYLRAMDRTVPESERYALASALVDEAEVNIKAARQVADVLERYRRIFIEVGGDHNRLAQVE